MSDKKKTPPSNQATQPDTHTKPQPKPGQQQFALVVVFSVAVAGLFISFLTKNGLNGSAALYVGLPLMLAYIFLIADKPKSATGSILKGTTIALLLSAPILQEGYICILIAAPIFYIVGAVVGLAVDYSRKHKHGRLQSTPVAVVMILFSLEGTHEVLTFNRDYTVRAEKIIAATPQAIKAQLALPMQFTGDTPWFLRVFPLPVWNTNEGTEPGDRRQMHFVYYKHFITSAKVGDLVFEVTEHSDNHITSNAIHDDSYLNTYLQWQSSTVQWKAIDNKHTKVVWEIRFQRKLDPAWYFAPLERYAATLAASTLIDSAATPASARQANAI